MNIDNIIDTVVEKMLDGDLVIGKYNKIPETKLIVLQQTSSKWWVQVPTPVEMGIPNNRKRLPTKLSVFTKDDAIKYDKKSFLAACRYGLKLIYKNEVLKDEGLPLFELKPTVKSISLKVITNLQNAKQKKGTYKDYIRILEKEIIPQLGDLYIQNLRLKEITDFFQNKQARSPTRITLAKTTFEKLFNYAELNNIILQRDRPNLSKLEIEKDLTPEYVCFRDDDIDFIKSQIQSFIEVSKNKKTKENRELFKYYIKFLRTTGVRTGLEATGILWKHIFISKAKNDRIVIKIAKGKIATGKNKTREICIDQDTIENLLELLMFQMGKNIYSIKKYNAFDSSPTQPIENFEIGHKNLINLIKMFKLENQPIFSRKDMKNQKDPNNGTSKYQLAIPNFGDCFNQLKEFLDDRLSDSELTLYSYRHYFITDKLINGIDIHHLARYCGTSVEMIEKHYSKLKARMASEFVMKNLDLETYKL